MCGGLFLEEERAGEDSSVQRPRMSACSQVVPACRSAPALALLRETTREQNCLHGSGTASVHRGTAVVGPGCSWRRDFPAGDDLRMQILPSGKQMRSAGTRQEGRLPPPHPSHQPSPSHGFLLHCPPSSTQALGMPHAVGTLCPLLHLWDGPLGPSPCLAVAPPFDPLPRLSLPSLRSLFLRIVCFPLHCSFFLIPLSDTLCFSCYFLKFFIITSSMLLYSKCFLSLFLFLLPLPPRTWPLPCYSFPVLWRCFFLLWSTQPRAGRPPRAGGPLERRLRCDIDLFSLNRASVHGQ